MSRPIHLVCPSCGGINRIPADRLAESPRCGKCKQQLFQAAPLEVDHTGFLRHMQRSEVPLLVDFWAPWCGPCKMMAPMFAAAAAQLEPAVRLLKVNTEANQQLASQFGIRSIPTLALFQGGQEIARTAGAMDTQNLVAWTRQQLAR